VVGGEGVSDEDCFLEYPGSGWFRKAEGSAEAGRGFMPFYLVSSGDQASVF
jgi:hypothetical protein